MPVWLVWVEIFVTSELETFAVVREPVVIVLFELACETEAADESCDDCAGKDTVDWDDVAIATEFPPAGWKGIGCPEEVDVTGGADVTTLLAGLLLLLAGAEPEPEGFTLPPTATMSVQAPLLPLYLYCEPLE